MMGELWDTCCLPEDPQLSEHHQAEAFWKAPDAEQGDSAKNGVTARGGTSRKFPTPEESPLANLIEHREDPGLPRFPSPST